MISYDVVVAATQGDPLAALAVLDYFDSYTDRLCTHSFVDGAGRVTYGVDQYRKTLLQGKLLSAMLRFKV